jgi:hypothetical protein
VSVVPIPVLSRQFGAAFLVACLLWAGGARPARALKAPGEYAVKAAFLVNFAGFVRWPAAAFADAQSPFVICIAGDDPFGDAFTPFEKGEVSGRALVVQSLASPASAPKKCHILFVAGSERPRLPGMLREAGEAAVLTVSDLEGFAADGGMIQLFTRNQKIRFEINRAAAEAAGLRVDARLLKLAEPARLEAGEERR